MFVEEQCRARKVIIVGIDSVDTMKLQKKVTMKES